MQDLTGQKFGRLTVLQYEYFKLYKNRTKHYYWRCRCECGNEKIINGISLKKGVTKSCGCLQKEQTSNKNKTHGLTDSRLFIIWANIKARCYNKNNPSYKNYGNRGIKMYQEWLNDFMNFYNWAITNGYKENLTIDRIDVNGNYEPNNCRWITNKEQQNNRRNNHYVTYNNETHTLAEWAKITNIKYSTLERRLNKYKWTITRALNIDN